MAVSKQTNILEEFLNDIPNTWTCVPEGLYEEGYYCEQLPAQSAEFQQVAEHFTQHCNVKYIKRVQNPYQLALFQVSQEKKKAEGDHYQVMQAYHVLYEKDLDTALKYTVDYRRYEHGQDWSDIGLHQRWFTEPKFFLHAKEAVNTFHNKDFGQDKLVLVCDVITQNFNNFIETSSQADYYVNYVVCIQHQEN